MQTKAISNCFNISRKLSPIATALLLALAPYSVAAEKDDHDHEVEQHGSHEHGVARLTVATTDDGLEVALESPAANVFGFEHAAKNDEEREVVHEALEKLKAGSVLFAVNAAASCRLESVNVEAPGAGSHDDEHHDDHEKEEKHDDHDHEKEEKHDDHDHEKEEKHDDHDHEKEEKHDDHDHEKEEKHDDDHEKEEKHDDHDHEKEHDDHADEASSHSDVEAVWGFHCEKPAAIETVQVKLFSAFPGGFEEIAVEWVTANGAGKTELKADGEVKLSR